MPTKSDEKRLWIVAAAVAFAGFFAVLIKKLISLPDKEEPEFQGKKMHCYLHLPAETIDKYLESGAMKMKFRFVDDNKRVKLHLAGYDAEDKQCFNKKINTKFPPGKDVELENKKFGYFEEESGGKLLHDILTEKPLRDWDFKPVECDLPDGAGYVSYDMSDKSLQRAIRVNPCPPGCN